MQTALNCQADNPTFTIYPNCITTTNYFEENLKNEYIIVYWVKLSRNGVQKDEYRSFQMHYTEKTLKFSFYRIVRY